MLKILKNKNQYVATSLLSKKQIELTGTLTNVLRPGAPVIYLYQGNLIRTSVVMAILEASPEYVRFETQNTIYTISFETTPVSMQRIV